MSGPIYGHGHSTAQCNQKRRRALSHTIVNGQSGHRPLSSHAKFMQFTGCDLQFSVFIDQKMQSIDSLLQNKVSARDKPGINKLLITDIIASRSFKFSKCGKTYILFNFGMKTLEFEVFKIEELICILYLRNIKHFPC